MIHFVVPRDTAFGVQDYLGRWGKGGAGRIMRPFREEARKYFYNRFQAALESIDPPGASATLIPIRYRPETLLALRRMARARHPARRFESVKALFRPLRPILDPIVKVLSPLLARVAHRRRESRSS